MPPKESTADLISAAINALRIELTNSITTAVKSVHSELTNAITTTMTNLRTEITQGATSLSSELTSMMDTALAQVPTTATLNMMNKTLEDW